MDPFAPSSWVYHVGRSLFVLNRVEEAVTKFEHALERTPGFFPASLYLVCSYVELGRLEEARIARETGFQAMPHCTIAYLKAKWAYRGESELERLVHSLRKVGVSEA
ncbi:MAG: hypothetical protein HOI95_20835 [Chromatiales bacterium]|jgi:hypothetical protein|nr:hypothetical protein [Chromatiales bacterium]